MSVPSSPARLGIWPEVGARLQQAGWMKDGMVVPEALGALQELRGGPDPEGAIERLAEALLADSALAARALGEPGLAAGLVALCGASRALARAVAREPDLLEAGDAPEAPLMTQVRRGQVEIAVRDLTGQDAMPAVGQALSTLADKVAARALDMAEAQARSKGTPDAPDIAFTVIAMGKWGGRELNYASDIDVLFVYDAAGDAAGHEAGRLAQRTASGFMEALGAVTAGGIAWRVDADLRPEGRSGPLARSLDSYRQYYERWAETWEFQALIKARVAAGDAEVGRRFLDMIEPFVYPDELAPEAVRTIRAMKRRAEAETAARVPGFEVKRGVGGIRDVEFAVQLLQLVHGRSDPSLRGAPTLDALRALDQGGYVRPEDAGALAESYQWLRNVEHRIQLWELRQTHELPEADVDRERIAKAMGYRDNETATALETFHADLVQHRGSVRTIHQRLFYRPLMEAFAQSPSIALTAEGAGRQLAALGFADVPGAQRAFSELTSGLSRRSRLMQQLLPLMMDWLSEAPHPDLGLHQLRLLVTTAKDNDRLIAELRDSPAAAERLCRLLGTSRLLGTLVDRIPASLRFMGDDASLAEVKGAKGVAEEARKALAARRDGAARRDALRRYVDGRRLRIAIRDLLGFAGPAEVGSELADLADAAVGGALELVTDELSERDEFAGRAPPRISVVAMGKWGGRELNYASDLDALFVYQADGDADPHQARSYAEQAVERLLTLDAGAARAASFRIDADLRPEGRSGILALNLDSYRSYYERRARTWEFQALTRARHAAGNADLGSSFQELIQPYVYQEHFGADQVREVRKMKARIEAERIPVGEDPEFHMKLGHGGQSDVEFLVQLMALVHGAGDKAVRVAGTREALRAMVESGLLDEEEGARLLEAYDFCSHVRNRLFLQTGRPRDSLPTDPEEANRLALSMGFDVHPRATLRETYRRLTRRARRVFERRFYDA